MRLRFGAYAGKTTEVLLLRAPDYAAWTMAQRPKSALARTFSVLSTAFDARPITAACRCGELATHARAYRNSTDLILLCDRCAEQLLPDPVLDDVSGYAAALDHVRRTCARGLRREQRRIVRRLGLAKGMPRRITEPAAEAFLAGVAD
jgi:hypothetical protein